MAFLAREQRCRCTGYLGKTRKERDPTPGDLTGRKRAFGAVTPENGSGSPAFSRGEWFPSSDGCIPPRLDPQPQDPWRGLEGRQGRRHQHLVGGGQGRTGRHRPLGTEPCGPVSAVWRLRVTMLRSVECADEEGNIFAVKR